MNRLIPVIHVINEAQVFFNIEICVETKTDGVFLINHRSNHNKLFKIAESVHKNFPNLWVGLNVLDLPTHKVFNKIPKWINGVWTDDGGIVEHVASNFIDTTNAELYDHVRINSEWTGEYFGGFAFKYQAPITNLETGARVAAKFMDVVTTSGDGTGIAADINKIRKVYNGAFLNARIGIASGITPENVIDYLPYVDDFLVSTGISDINNMDNLDKEKILRLKDCIFN